MCKTSCGGESINHILSYPVKAKISSQHALQHTPTKSICHVEGNYCIVYYILLCIQNMCVGRFNNVNITGSREDLSAPNMICTIPVQVVM